MLGPSGCAGGPFPLGPGALCSCWALWRLAWAAAAVGSLAAAIGSLAAPVGSLAAAVGSLAAAVGVGVGRLLPPHLSLT